MNNNTIHKLVIIGSGPAGLTAGIYAARSNLKPIIIEGNTPGGQLVSTPDVENWPGVTSISGIDLVTNLRKHTEKFECTFIPGSVKKVSKTGDIFSIMLDTNKEIKAYAVIIASGATPKKLGYPGEQEYWGKGVSVCAVCDGAFYQDKEVVVVGGGNTAMEAAAFLTNFTNKITVVHILDKLTAFPPEQERVLNNQDTTIIYNSTVTEILGDGKQIQKVVIEQQKTGKKRTLKADGLFVAIGFRPNTDFLKETLDLDEWGYIKLDKECQDGETCTSVEGIFAAGDVGDFRYRQAITAAGMGCMAALDAERYLKKITSS